VNNVQLKSNISYLEFKKVEFLEMAKYGIEMQTYSFIEIGEHHVIYIIDHKQRDNYKNIFKP